MHFAVIWKTEVLYCIVFMCKYIYSNAKQFQEFSQQNTIERKKWNSGWEKTWNKRMQSAHFLLAEKQHIHSERTDICFINFPGWAFLEHFSAFLSISHSLLTYFWWLFSYFKNGFHSIINKKQKWEPRKHVASVQATVLLSCTLCCLCNSTSWVKSNVTY